MTRLSIQPSCKTFYVELKDILKDIYFVYIATIKKYGLIIATRRVIRYETYNIKNFYYSRLMWRYRYQDTVEIKGGLIACCSAFKSIFLIKKYWILFIGDMKHWSVKSAIFPKKNCSCIIHKLLPNL